MATKDIANVVTFPNQTIVSCGSASGGSCGSKSEKPILTGDDRHPCYSENAQHHYARLHLPVAPACNMQCNYCNRKFDCSNESRPGVVSCLLKPDEAIRRVEKVTSKLDNLAVVGIAGPGDPLANPERVFSTIEKLNSDFPELITCLSTNGLNLNLYADDLINLGVRHITVTLNTIDPFISKQIYDWIYFNGKKYTGVLAGEILLEQQIAGIEKIVEGGAKVKINSVMIPGINDGDIQNVSKVIKMLGVEMHNIMPLISKPEFDTHFSRIGQREPTYEELTDLRDSCSVDMKMMRHCRQCRADAVGLLGEDQSGCFSDKSKQERIKQSNPEPHKVQAEAIDKQKVVVASESASKDEVIRVAVTTSGHNLINQHFGHAKQFLVYKVSADKVEFEGVKRSDQYCVGSCDDDKESVLDNSISALEGVDVVLTARIGYHPKKKLQEAGIDVCLDYPMEVIDNASRLYFDKKVKEKKPISGAK